MGMSMVGLGKKLNWKTVRANCVGSLFKCNVVLILELDCFCYCVLKPILKWGMPFQLLYVYVFSHYHDLFHTHLIMLFSTLIMLKFNLDTYLPMHKRLNRRCISITSFSLIFNEFFRDTSLKYARWFRTLQHLYNIWVMVKSISHNF